VKKLITSDQWKLAPPRTVPGVPAADFRAGMMDRVTVVRKDNEAI
jgi:hypothetical protein